MTDNKLLILHKQRIRIKKSSRWRFNEPRWILEKRVLFDLNTGFRLKRLKRLADVFRDLLDAILKVNAFLRE